MCNLEPLLSALGAYSSGSSSTGKDVSTSLTATITTASTAVTTANGSQTPPQTPPEWDGDLRITSLQAAYRAGISPVNVIHTLYAKIEAYESVNPGTWIHLLPKETLLSAAQDLEARWPDRRARPPLFGIPFSVKDSIDVSGLPTTTACPPLTHIPATSAPVYEASVAAGALFLGKANLDQLATGLTGQRSPYGAPSSVFHPSFISGGSSSGSAVHVGAGLASFSIATDTAGSGRVPAAFNGIVGYKPTRGTVSFVGITPACLRLDCVAIMTATVEDARTVYSVVEGFDARDPYAKPREWRAVSLRHVDALPLTAATASPMTRQLRPQFTFGIPPPDALAAANLSAPYRAAFASTVARLQRLGGVLRPIPWTPFREAGELLYDGTFVCERLAAIPLLDGSDGSEAATWLQRYREELHPVIATLFAQVLSRKTSGATQVFKELQTQQRLTSQVANEVFTRGATGVDVLVVPTTPTHFTKRQIAEEPIKRNSILGTFTHYGNVIDLCAVACPAALVEAKDMIPAGELEEDGSGGNADDNEGGGVLPFGVTFLGGTGADAEVLEIARRFEELARREGAI